ncbi:MAG: hypothetical protein ACI35W_07195 [Anaeroplasmataceae bacterium]
MKKCKMLIFIIFCVFSCAIFLNEFGFDNNNNLTLLSDTMHEHSYVLDENSKRVNEDGSYFISYTCECEDSYEVLVRTIEDNEYEFEAINSLSNIGTDGYYYLTSDIDSEYQEISGNVYLDINGHNISGDTEIVMYDGTLNIYDCISNGNISSSYSDFIYMEAGVVNLYNLDISNSNKGSKAAVIYADGGVINLYNTIIRNSKNGIYLAAGTLNVYNSSFSQNEIGIYNKNGTINIYEASLESTKYDIYNESTFNLFGELKAASENIGLMTKTPMVIFSGAKILDTMSVVLFDTTTVISGTITENASILDSTSINNIVAKTSYYASVLNDGLRYIAKVNSEAELEITTSSHIHDLTFEISEDKKSLTVSCSNTDNLCDYDKDEVTITLNVSDKEYDGAKADVILEGKEELEKMLGIGLSIEYYSIIDAKLSSAPIIAGKYKAKVNVLYNEVNYSIFSEYTISRCSVMYPLENTNNYIYNGQEQEYIIASNPGYKISNNKQTNAGNYKVLISLTDNNYQWNDGKIDDIEYDFIINRCPISKPVYDTTIYTYDGTEKIYIIDNHEGYNVENNKRTESGEQYVIITINDNYIWNDNTLADLNYLFVINKATYDMSNISFESQKILYDGNIHSIFISGALPSGVEVTYESNSQREVGCYKVIASFVGDINYNEIPKMEAILDIMSTKMESNDVSIIYSNGLPSQYNLSVSNDKTDNYKAILNNNEQVSYVYKIKLVDDNNTEINLSSITNEPICLSIKLPADLNSFRLVLVVAGEAKEIIKSDTLEVGTYVIEDGNLKTMVTSLSEFVFIENNSSSCILHFINIGIIVLYIIFVLVFILVLKKKYDNLIFIIVSGLMVLVELILSIIGIAMSCKLCIIFLILALLYAIAYAFLWIYNHKKKVKEE